LGPFQCVNLIENTQKITSTILYIFFIIKGGTSNGKTKN
jgi:hypothetical protein